MKKRNDTDPLSLLTLYRCLWSIAVLFAGLVALNSPIEAAEEATPLESIQIMSGNYRKGGGVGVIGHLGGTPVSIPKEYAYFVEYDGDSGFLEKRKEPVPNRTLESGICSFGFDLRYPDFAPINKKTWKDKLNENIHTTMWMHVGIRSNSAYQDRSPTRMARKLVRALEWAPPSYHYVEQQEKVHGLTAYIPVDVKIPFRNTNNIYVHKVNDGGVDSYIRCSNVDHDAAPCSQMFGLAPELKASIDVSYRKGLLPHWREIQEGVTQVILGFRANPSKTPSVQPHSSQSQ
jgi:hypothetical protein